MKKFVFIPILTIFCFIFLTACNTASSQATVKGFNPDKDEYISSSTKISSDIDINNIPQNEYDILSVPTCITKIKDTYFIVDCYHNQVLYNDNLNDSIDNWLVMTKDINMGHTIASDGSVYLIDDTENHRILIMEEATNDNHDTVYIPTQEFNNIGTRPHYIIYNDKDDTFYVLSSMTGEMFLFRKSDKDNTVYLTKKYSIPELDGYYVRSFTIMDDHIYFVSGNANILEAALNDFTVINRYPVPVELCGMVQLCKIEDYYYITVSTDGYGSQDAATMIRTRDLNSLISMDYETVYDNFIGGGTPYSINQIDDYYYLCEHRLPGHNIWKFQIKDNNIIAPETIY